MAKVFISYSHRDEKALERLHKHLVMLRREKLIEQWFDREILAGGNIDREIKKNLTASDVFLALVSPDFLASDYCYDIEMTEALRRHDEGSIRVVPVILEPCDWTASPLGKLKALPKDGKPVSVWTNENVAYVDVATELRRLLNSPTNDSKSTVESDSTLRNSSTTKNQPRKYRIKRDFDAIDRNDFKDRAFAVIRDYFRNSIDELNSVGDPIRARYESMGEHAFTSTVLNKAAREKEAHITVHADNSHSFGGDISFSFSRRAPNNTANGFVRVEADEYELYLKLDPFSAGREAAGEARSPEQIAEVIWREFISRAGIDHD